MLVVMGGGSEVGSRGGSVVNRLTYEGTPSLSTSNTCAEFSTDGGSIFFSIPLFNYYV